MPARRRSLYFLNIASCGATGLICRIVDQAAKRLGSGIAFYLGTVRGLLPSKTRPPASSLTASASPTPTAQGHHGRGLQRPVHAAACSFAPGTAHRRTSSMSSSSAQAPFEPAAPTPPSCIRGELKGVASVGSQPRRHPRSSPCPTARLHRVRRRSAGPGRRVLRHPAALPVLGLQPGRFRPWRMSLFSTGPGLSGRLDPGDPAGDAGDRGGAGPGQLGVRPPARRLPGGCGAAGPFWRGAHRYRHQPRQRVFDFEKAPTQGRLGPRASPRRPFAAAGGARRDVDGVRAGRGVRVLLTASDRRLGRHRHRGGVGAVGLAYGGPYPLGYHGLGDVFVFTFLGLVAVGGTVFVQTGELPHPRLVCAVAGQGAGHPRCWSSTTSATLRPTAWPASARSPCAWTAQEVSPVPPDVARRLPHPGSLCSCKLPPRCRCSSLPSA